MNQVYCPFQVIETMLAISAGLHAVSESQNLNEADHQAVLTAYELLEQASQSWIHDLASRVQSAAAPSVKKDVLHRNLVAPMTKASHALETVKGFDFSELLRVLHGQRGLAQYYIEHLDEVMQAQKNNPDIKAKLLAHFGDMLVP